MLDNNINKNQPQTAGFQQPQQSQQSQQTQQSTAQPAGHPELLKQNIQDSYVAYRNN